MATVYSPRPEHQNLVHHPSEQMWYDIIYAQIDDWHLKVADRVMNGWKDENGNDCITGQTDYMKENATTHHIPHSAFAVLQIVLFYFEFIAFFKTGAKYHTNKRPNGSTWCYFRDGVDDVFDEYRNVKPSPHEALYYVFRNGLYHVGINETFSLSGGIETIFQHHFKGERYDVWTLNPHKLVPRLREHLKQYVDQLKSPDSQYEDLRHNFRVALTRKYIIKRQTHQPKCE